MLQLQDAPLSVQKVRSAGTQPLGLWTSIRSLPDRLRNFFAPLWHDDPAIARFLAEPFLSEFKGQYDRLVREHGARAADGRFQSAFVSRLQADSFKTGDRLFDVVVQQYSSIEQLAPQHRAQVLMRLMQHCCLPGSAWF